jgi:hypothetical protein
MADNSAPRQGDVYLKLNGVNDFIEIPSSFIGFKVQDSRLFRTLASIRRISAHLPRPDHRQ